MADGPVVTLGWEPQYISIKNADTTGAWLLLDSVRGMAAGADNLLIANTNAAESVFDYLEAQAAGFKLTSVSAGTNATGAKYIFHAIRKP